MTGSGRVARAGRVLALCLLGCARLLLPPCAGAGEQVLLDERFASLDRWQPFAFAKIARQSSYRATTLEGRTCLLMESDNSASGLILKERFDIYQYPRLFFRWRVSNVYHRGDSSRKDGDDYPARLYVLFAFDPDRASLGRRLRYGLVKAIYGQYPPDSSLSYIWDNRPGAAAVITSPYADEAKMIPIDAGPERAGTWQEHAVDMLGDYRAAFGKDPPATAALAVMNDSDNTREASRAWIERIRIYRDR